MLLNTLKGKTVAPHQEGDINVQTANAKLLNTGIHSSTNCLSDTCSQVHNQGVAAPGISVSCQSYAMVSSVLTVPFSPCSQPLDS